MLADTVTPPHLDSEIDGPFICWCFQQNMKEKKVDALSILIRIRGKQSYFSKTEKTAFSSVLILFLKKTNLNKRQTKLFGTYLLRCCSNSTNWAVVGSGACKFKHAIFAVVEQNETSAWAHVVIQKMSFILMLMSQHTNHILFNKRKSSISTWHLDSSS